MSSNHIFISHASDDKAFVEELRLALEGQKLPVWVDSRNLRGGDKLAPAIEQAIVEAGKFIAVIGPNTAQSGWVKREIAHALAVEERDADGYRVIPLLLPGMGPEALDDFFDEEPVAVSMSSESVTIHEVMPAILAALGEHYIAHHQAPRAVKSKPVEELVLKLQDPKLEFPEGKRLLTATATLTYAPADASVREVESGRYTFTAPIGPIEADDIRWYLEDYFRWPVGNFKKRAERTEEQLPEWGQAMYEAAFDAKAAQTALNAWNNAAKGSERRVSIWVDNELTEGTSEEDTKAASEAASALHSLPWEIMHDGRAYLSKGKNGVRIRRRLPNRHIQPMAQTDLPIRILLVSPRPDDKHAGYIDHRVSAKPLVEALEKLGNLIQLKVLTPPTFKALDKELTRAADDGKAYHVIHFDGHGVYNREKGLGGLCFEDPKDATKLQEREMQLIDADKMGELIRDHRIPLFFLEACQSAKVDQDPTASVAAKLLEEGVTSVVAMTHSVLVETARRFVGAFYAELAQGARIGKAMLAGQKDLMDDSYRLKIMGAGDLRLQDWFVPVLYQEEQDLQLFKTLPPDAVRKLETKKRKYALGELPDAPPHLFQGRSRELLALERLLHDAPYAVVQGPGGSGKTTMAVEQARWLVQTERFKKAAFVSLEQVSDVRTVLDSLGRQLLPQGETYSVAQFNNEKEALQPVERALSEHPTIILLDNMESVLPDSEGNLPASAAPIEELFDLCTTLLDADPATRIIFTSREPLPKPFNNAKHIIPLGALAKTDAIELVSRVMANEGLQPEATDPGGTPEEVEALVEAVNRHPRALLLLAREIAKQGVNATTHNLQQLMAELERKNPGDRENSLYASVELSLRRLPDTMRDQVKTLAVFHGGANLNVLGMMTEQKPDMLGVFAESLVKVGLAEDMGYGHLRLDPALPPYLLAAMKEPEREAAQAAWAQGMTGLTGFLYEQQFKDANLASQLTLLELPNLMAMLDWVQDKVSPENVVNLAGSVEQLLQNLGRPRALDRAVKLRESAARKLGAWDNTSFGNAARSVERLLDAGDMRASYEAAQRLLQRCLAEGLNAYPGAAYDTAIAHFLLGRVLQMGGNAGAALEPLEEAHQRFQALADGGNTSAEHMASAAVTETSHCLILLGRLGEAAGAYEESIRRDEKRDAKRDVAINKLQLGTVRMLQERYQEALEIYVEARETFETLGEPGSVSTVWHQIGMVHARAGQFDEAERAYRESLAIEVQRKNRASEAASLGDLGNVYGKMGRLEEAVTFHSQAADIDAQLGDLNGEGQDRSNMANVLVKLERYDEARREILRAIECMKPFGHAAEPWKTWDILCDLEQAAGKPDDALAARGKAIDAYAAYRRDGGESHTSGQLYTLVAQALQQGQTGQAEQLLTQLASHPDVPAGAKALVPKLQAILKGDRDPALADDPALHFTDAAELRILLENI